jgi:hypothetical protein
MSNTNVVNVITATETPNRIIITSARAPGIQQFLYQVQIFTVPGTLSVGVGKARFYVPGPMTLSNVRASVSTPSTGADIIVDVNVNGSTIFTSQLARPKIFAGSVTCPTATPNLQELETGDYISVDIDQVGSLFAGADLTVQIELTP